MSKKTVNKYVPLQSIIRFLCLHRKAAAAKIAIPEQHNFSWSFAPCLYVNNEGVESACLRGFYKINTFWIVMVHNVFQDESSIKRLCKVQNVCLHKKKKLFQSSSLHNSSSAFFVCPPGLVLPGKKHWERLVIWQKTLRSSWIFPAAHPTLTAGMMKLELPLTSVFLCSTTTTKSSNQTCSFCVF